MVAEHRRPRNFERVQQVAHITKGGSRIIKRAVDDIARNNNEVGVGLRNKRANVVAAQRIKRIGSPCRNFIRSQTIGGSPLQRIDDLHIGQLQNFRVFIGYLHHKITTRKHRVFRVCNHRFSHLDLSPIQQNLLPYYNITPSKMQGK